MESLCIFIKKQQVQSSEPSRKAKTSKSNSYSMPKVTAAAAPIAVAVSGSMSPSADAELLWESIVATAVTPDHIRGQPCLPALIVTPDDPEPAPNGNLQPHITVASAISPDAVFNHHGQHQQTYPLPQLSAGLTSPSSHLPRTLPRALLEQQQQQQQHQQSFAVPSHWGPIHHHHQQQRQQQQQKQQLQSAGSVATVPDHMQHMQHQSSYPAPSFGIGPISTAIVHTKHTVAVDSFQTSHSAETIHNMLLPHLDNSVTGSTSLQPATMQASHTAPPNNASRSTSTTDTDDASDASPTTCVAAIPTGTGSVVEFRAIVPMPQRNRRRKHYTPMLLRAPTIRHRVAQLESAAQFVYNTYRSASTTTRGPVAIIEMFNKELRTTFEKLVTAPTGTGALVKRQNTNALSASRCSDFENFLLGVASLAVQHSQQELALANAAQQAMMRRVRSATAVLELRKSALDKLPLCVLAKAMYPDWTNGGIWLNKRTMEVLRVDPRDCPDQMMPMATFMPTLSHPATRAAATLHVAVSIAKNRPDACLYRIWTRADGSHVAGVFSSKYLLGPPPLHRFYFAYMFFQPLPIQPLDMNEWARRAITMPDKNPTASQSSHSVTPASAKYPGIMHQLIQDHIQMHPEDEETLPPNPTSALLPQV
jgi:hypothetical protein